MKSRILLLIYMLTTFFYSRSQSDSSHVRKWYIPDHGKLHFAGEIGFLSVGVGYELFRNKNGEFDVFGGFLPENIGGDNLATMAVKFHYMPWKIAVFDHQHTLEPLTLGAIAYHAFGDDLNRVGDRDLYPAGYYWWAVRTRFGPFFGSRLTRTFDSGSMIRSLTLYCELGTNDLYIYS